MSYREFGAPVVLSLLAVTSVALVGCERVAQGDPATPREARVVEASAAPEGPVSCDVDADCQGYLRCAKGRCATPPAVHGVVSSDTPSVRFSSKLGEERGRFWVEVARSDAQMRRGLMFRRQMHDAWGMLFVYEDEAPRSFWMENTFIPLDMIFIDAEGRVVSIIEGAEPLTRVPRRSEGAARYVLEVNAGRAAEVSISPGDRVEFDGLEAHEQPSTDDSTTP